MSQKLIHSQKGSQRQKFINDTCRDCSQSPIRLRVQANHNKMIIWKKDVNEGDRTGRLRLQIKFWNQKKKTSCAQASFSLSTYSENRSSFPTRLSGDIEFENFVSLQFCEMYEKVFEYRGSLSVSTAIHHWVKS